MKSWHLFIGIVVILAIVCSPALAISKSDLISQYKGTSSPTIITPIPTPTPSPLTFGPSVGGDIYPHIPASYYEWSKFPAPGSVPPPISDEEWEGMMAKIHYSSTFE
jgi:hypothetical protein